MKAPRKQVVFLVAAIVIALFIGFGSRTKTFSRLYFQGIDAVGKPGEEVEVSALVERRDHFGLRRMLAGVPVTFHHEGRMLGGANTNADGIAAFPFQTSGAGYYEVEARIESPDLPQLRTTLLVAAVEADETILVVDIDHAVAKSHSFPKSLLGMYYDLVPVPGAREALDKLFGDYQIFYLCDRSDRNIRTTKEWLASHGFPPGPLCVKTGSFLLQTADFRRKTLLAWKAKWENLAAGIGDSATDADAFLAAGLRAYVLDSGVSDGMLPQGAINVRDWEELTYLVRSTF